MARFQCCYCLGIEFLDIHHLKPKYENGPNTFNNAIPLCTNCHRKYGDNKQLRKYLKEKRDWWYEQCSKLEPQTILKLVEKEVDRQIKKLRKSSSGLKFMKEGKTN